jgi:hypothetical protein
MLIAALKGRRAFQITTENPTKVCAHSDVPWGRFRRRTSLRCELEWLAIQYLKNYWPRTRWFVGLADRSEFCICCQCRLFPLGDSIHSAMETTNGVFKDFVGSFYRSFVTAIRYVRCAPELQIVLGRNVLFALFISLIPAVVPVVGLKVLHLNSSNLGLLFTSMGTGSVVSAARARKVTPAPVLRPGSALRKAREPRRRRLRG